MEKPSATQLLAITDDKNIYLPSTASLNGFGDPLLPCSKRHFTSLTILLS